MTLPLTRAWESISKEQQDTTAFENFRPDLYRYTNSTNPWKSRTKTQFTISDADSQIALAVRGEAIGPRSKRNTILAMDRQGGPALTLTDEWRSNANSDQFRMVLLDPRGSGASIPLGDIQNNTAQKLVWDMEQARRLAALQPDEKMVLRGNCWGMTESVLYTNEYPDQVAGLVLGLPFLARQKDIEWMYAPDNGLSRKYPTAYSKFWEYTRLNNVTETMDRFIFDLGSPDERIRADAFCAFTAWEYAYYDGEFTSKPDEIDMSSPYIQQEIATRRIQARFTRDQFDMSGDGITPLLDTIPKNIPIIIVGNLYDPLNAPDTIDIIKNKLPQAEIIMQDADWHWIPKGTVSQSKSNEFIQQAYPYAMGRMGFISSGQCEISPGFKTYQRMIEPC